MWSGGILSAPVAAVTSAASGAIPAAAEQNAAEQRVYGNTAITEQIVRMLNGELSTDEIRSLVSGIAEAADTTDAREMQKIYVDIFESTGWANENAKNHFGIGANDLITRYYVPAAGQTAQGGGTRPGTAGVSPAQQSSPARGSDAVDGTPLEEKQQSLIQKAKTLYANELGDNGNASRDSTQADSNFTVNRNRHNELVTEARGREQAVEAAVNKREEYINSQLKALSDKLKVSEEKLRAAWDLAKFYKDKCKFDLDSAIRQAVLEVIGENQNVQAEIIRAFHAICMKMNDAILGTKTSAGGFDPKRYLTVKDPGQNKGIEQEVLAQNSQREYNADVAQLDNIKRDTFNDEQIAKARKNAEVADSERNSAESDMQAAARRKEEMRKNYEGHRAKYAGMLADVQKLGDRIKLLQEENKNTTKTSNT